MEYLQYKMLILLSHQLNDDVLNLIINGIPSILLTGCLKWPELRECFKPYYKWNTFNTYYQLNEVLII